VRLLNEATIELDFWEICAAVTEYINQRIGDTEVAWVVPSSAAPVDCIPYQGPYRVKLKGRLLPLP